MLCALPLLGIGVLAAASPSRVAVVGGGLAGLGTAAHLLIDAPASSLTCLDVYDSHLPGQGGASQCARLLHPFTPKGREIWHGRAGFEASASLIAQVERVAGPCSSVSGLLRLALTDEQAGMLSEAATCSSDCLSQTWLTRAQAADLAGARGGGLGAAHSSAALTVDVPSYLHGLWQLCETLCAERGVSSQWRLGEVRSLLPLLREYDAVIVTLGSRATNIAGLEGLPFRCCRGQNLLMTNRAGLRVPLISGKYIVPVRSPSGEAQLIAGATFEYGESEHCHRPAEPEAAETMLRAPLGALHEPFGEEATLAYQAGVRALPPRTHLGYVPLAGRLGHSLSTDTDSASTDDDLAECWMLGGLGSRGLIHHALLGRALALAVIHGDESHLPEHCRRLQGQLPSPL